MSDEITKTPYTWQLGTDGRGEQLKPAEAIIGGIDDSRFEPTAFDELKLRANRARQIAIVTPYIISFLWEALMGNIFKNWKTTLAAIIMLAAQVLPALDVITVDQAVSITGLAAAFGLISAKDSNVTGGTKPQ